MQWGEHHFLCQSRACAAFTKDAPGYMDILKQHWAVSCSSPSVQPVADPHWENLQCSYLPGIPIYCCFSFLCQLALDLLSLQPPRYIQLWWGKKKKLDYSTTLCLSYPFPFYFKSQHLHGHRVCVRSKFAVSRPFKLNTAAAIWVTYSRTLNP